MPASSTKKPAKPSGKDRSKPRPAATDNNNNNNNPTPAGAPAPKLKPATAINARHILCEKHAKKEEALARLRAGANFSDVAREFSEDKARQGGALGWKVRGGLVAAFEACAYGLEVSTPARPVWGECRSGEGYHVVMVEGRR